MNHDSFRGCLSSHSSTVLSFFLLGLILCSTRSDPVVLIIIYGTLIGHPLSGLLNNSTLFLFCCAFVATSFQGLAHAISGEEGTLVVVQNEKNEVDKVSYEWSHVVFFPNILIHACFQKLNLIKHEKLSQM
jgi:hypothetical protein